MKQSKKQVNNTFLSSTIDFLLEKLTFIKFSPQKILLIGRADLTDTFYNVIFHQYPNSEIHTLTSEIQAFQLIGEPYDLILSHGLSQHTLLNETNDPHTLLFYLLYHLLAPNGLLLFSSIGPETTISLTEYEDITAELPMQMLGDILLQLNYQDPVMDRDILSYPEGVLELIYGHAWKKSTDTCYAEKDGEGNIFMPLSQIEHL